MPVKVLITAALLVLSFAAWAESPPAPSTPPPATGTPPAQANEGIAYIFLIDTSKSVTPEQFEQIKKGLNAWIEAMGEKDRMTILTFGNEVRVLVDFTQSTDLLQVAAGKLKLEDTKTKLHTALLRAIDIGVRKEGDLPARRAIVLLSDGIDDYTGALNREEVVERVKAAKVPIFAVGFSNPPVTPEKEQALDALKRFAEVSGGYYERVDKKNFEEIYIEIRRRIRKLPMPAAASAGTAAEPGKAPELPPVATAGAGTGVGKLVPSALRKNEAWRTLWLAALALAVLAGLFLIARWVITRLQLQPPPATVSTGAAVAKPSFQPRQPIAYIEHAGGVIEVFSFPCTVGAVRDNDIVINHDSISRYHATLDYRQGKFYVTDRDSTNGTRVGGKEVKEAEITEGTRLAFGSWEGVFRVGNPAEVRARPAVAPGRPMSAMLSTPVLAGIAAALLLVVLAAAALWLLGSRSPGDEFQEALEAGGNGPMMVVVPGGKFFMGDVQRKGKPNEQPVHEVEVQKFAIGKHEVTFAEYDLYCQVTGKPKPADAGFGRGMNPVINVSWKDAVAYTQWLSDQTGSSYRLPTEAEWEYAARGGGSGAFWWGDAPLRDNGNFGQDACCGPAAAAGADRWGGVSPVGSFPGNPFGLHDVAGNVFEWTCSSYYEPYSGQESVCNPDDTLRKVFRGGSWGTPPDYSRSAWRLGRNAADADPTQGFRVAMDL